MDALVHVKTEILFTHSLFSLTNWEKESPRIFEYKLVGNTFTNSSWKTSLFSDTFRLTVVDFFREFYKYNQIPVKTPLNASKTVAPKTFFSPCLTRFTIFQKTSTVPVSKSSQASMAIGPVTLAYKHRRLVILVKLPEEVYDYDS